MAAKKCHYVVVYASGDEEVSRRLATARKIVGRRADAVIYKFCWVRKKDGTRAARRTRVE